MTGQQSGSPFHSPDLTSVADHTSIGPMTAKKVNSSSDPGTRQRRRKDQQEIVLLCNPRAGGRWKELADILDSDEARFVLRIVTDSVQDLAPALANIGDTAKLVCIYGGDGTIQRVLDAMIRDDRDRYPQLALLGGGTMNVTSQWCGLTRSPGDNFRDVVRGYRSGELLLKEIPLLSVRQGERTRRGFTFGIGSIIRILDAYEKGHKSKLSAIKLGLKSIVAAWTTLPRSFQPVIAPMQAEVLIDGEPQPHRSYVLVFCNVTGTLNPGVVPFVGARSRDTFYIAAYAIGPREIAAMSPFLMRGLLPIDWSLLLNPVGNWEKIAESYKRGIGFPKDPRYLNKTAARCEIRTDDPVYTVDGEVMPSTGEPITVELGPRLQLAVSGAVDLSPPLRLAAEATKGTAKPPPIETGA